MKTKTVAIDTLVPDPNNTRLHGARNIEAIKASLTKYGQVEPLIVRQDTKIVIGGNGRLEAMKLLGWKQVSIVELDLDETQSAALSIALNRTSDMSSFDANALDAMIRSLQSSGVNIAEELGFDKADMDALARAADRHQVSGLAQDDDEPYSPRAQSSVPSTALATKTKTCPTCGQETK